jgi:hypothetical protein
MTRAVSPGSMCARPSLFRALAWLGAALAAPGLATADVIDQSYLPSTGQGYNLSASLNLPLGQEFTPTLTSLNFVDLDIGDASFPPGSGANFQVDIRAGSVTGTLLGSATASDAAGTNFAGTLGILTRFTFASPVALTPGQVYVIDAFQIAPLLSSNANFLLYGGPLSASTYPGGRAIVAGSPVAAFDFAFREGQTAVPEPSSLALAAIGLGGAGAVAFRRRRAAAAG